MIRCLRCLAQYNLELVQAFKRHTLNHGVVTHEQQDFWRCYNCDFVWEERVVETEEIAHGA